MILMTLPLNWKMFTMTLTERSKKQKESPLEKKSGEKAFKVTSQFKGKCRICGKPGHMAKDCWNKEGGGKNPHFQKKNSRWRVMEEAEASRDSIRPKGMEA